MQEIQNAMSQITSISIRREMERRGIVTAELIGTAGAGDNRISIYQIGAVRVAETNGDPIWEESDPEGFAEALAQVAR